jgi:MYXO-CTERM domain-containing protein
VRALLIAAAAAGALATACQDGAPTGADQAAITSGSADAGDPAVVALVDDAGTAGCTGTVIAAHTILTAAHCLEGLDPTALRVFFGDAVAAGGTWSEITDGAADPAFDPGTFAHDVALLTIREAAPAAPVPLDPRTPDGTWVGTTFRVVGFGLTAGGAGDAGQRRAGTAQVTAVGALDFDAGPAPSQPCNGDSGGPALFDDAATTYVTGVVSHGDAACTDHATFARIDAAQADFIQPYLAATAPGTAATGDRCFYDDQCATGPCLPAADEPGRSFCAGTCTGDGDCPDGMTCASDGCRWLPPSPGSIGWPCTGPADCGSGQCYLGAGDPTGACTVSCLGVDATCPDGFTCVAVGGIERDCLASGAPGGCCSASAGSGGGAAGSALLVVAVGLIGRRRRRR